MTYSDPSGYFPLAECSVTTSIQSALCGVHQVRSLQKLVKWANAATTVYDTAVEIREIMLGGGTLLDVFAVMRGGAVVGFMVDGMCETSLRHRAQTADGNLWNEGPGRADTGDIQERGPGGNHGQQLKCPVFQGHFTRESLRRANFHAICSIIVEMFCMLFGLTSQCFTGDTLVSTEDGLRPIEDI